MPNKGMLQLHTIHDHHDHPTAGHFGETKTTELVCHKFHWPSLRCMVKDYIRSCTSCVRTKVPHHKPYGLLKQLPIPGVGRIIISYENRLPSIVLTVKACCHYCPDFYYKFDA